MSISSVIKSIQDIMRKDAGVDGDAQRLGQLSWLLFLKIFDAREEELEFELDDYQAPIPEQYLWRNWATDKEGKTGETLLAFVDELFTGLKNLNAPVDLNPRGAVVKSAFSDAFNYMKNGTLLRQVINKLNEVDFTRKQDRHLFGDIYEQILKDLQSAGNAGEFYTPRAVTQFAVNRVNPQIGERLLDPAAGTGGFLACAIDHLKPVAQQSTENRMALQQQIHGFEKKQLPHLLCVTNMLLHGIEVPVNIRHDNTLNKPLANWDDTYQVIVTNPPFGGTEEDGIERNFPTETRTRETADLFLQLIVEVLADKGRAAVVLPDGTLFGEGVKSKIKELLTDECNLHTIVRLPNGVFNPYTGIKTNILFFTKGTPTTDIWFYEHPYPTGVKNYNKTKPMRFEEFETEIAWWGDEADGFAARMETEQAWKVDFAAQKAQARQNAKPHWDKAAALKRSVEVLKQQLLEGKIRLKMAKEQKVDSSAQAKAVKDLEQQISDQQAQTRASQQAGDAVYYAVFNFDIKNPFRAEAVVHDPATLLAEYQAQQDEIQALRDQLKGILGDALAGSAPA